jgi:hypothetical protein
VTEILNYCLWRRTPTRTRFVEVAKMTKRADDPTPWSRPRPSEVRKILDGIKSNGTLDVREIERMALTVPADIHSSRGSVIPAMTRDLSISGIGLLHRGSISLDDVHVVVASDTVRANFRVKLTWCKPCENGLFLSGGCFLSEIEA